MKTWKETKINMAKSKKDKEEILEENDVASETVETEVIEEEKELTEVEKLQRQIDIDAEVYKRTLAEYDNFRKRSAKEKSETYSNATSNAVQTLLPVIDTLEMAISAPCEDENYKKGVEMTLVSAKTAFEKLGVVEVGAVGEMFDPNLHAAVLNEDVEGKESGSITKVLLKGYKMNDKVIRHAMVAVNN